MKYLLYSTIQSLLVCNIILIRNIIFVFCVLSFSFSPSLKEAHSQTPAVLSPKIATAGRIGTTIIWSKVAAHRGKDAKTAFHKVFSFSHQFPDALVIIVSSLLNS